MGIISSINFKKSNAIQTRHNDRDLPPNYLIGGNCEVNRNCMEALKLKNQIIENAIETYNSKKAIKAPPFKAKSYEWSAVCNIKPETSMADLEKLAKYFNNKYGFQCYQIAIHRDEGYVNEQGEKVINHHAHLEFITLDKETGKNKFRRELITPKALRQMQTEVSEILKMERGQDKRITKRQRIEPRKYAQMKEQERKALREQYQTLYEVSKEVILSQKQQILTLMEQKHRLEQERKSWIQEKTHTAEEYKALRALAEKGKTAEQLESEIQALREKHMQFIDLSKAYKEEKESLKTKINTLESDLKHEKQKNDVLVAKTKEIDFRAISDNLKLENERLRQENQELREQNNIFLEFCNNIKQKIDVRQILGLIPTKLMSFFNIHTNEQPHKENNEHLQLQLKILKEHTDIFTSSFSPRQKEQSHNEITEALENIRNLLHQDSSIALDKKDSMLIQRATKLVNEYEKNIARNDRGFSR